MMFRMLELLFVEFCMSYNTFRRHCFCYVISSTNIVDTLHKAKSTFKMKGIKPVIIPTLTACPWMILHDQSPHLVHDLIISVFWGPTRKQVTLHWCAPIFESAVPLLNLYDAYGIVGQIQLNLPYGFYFAQCQISCKIWCNTAVQVVPSFHGQWKSDESWVHSLSLSGRLLINATICGLERIYACTWRYPSPSPNRTSPMFHLFLQEKFDSDTFK